MEKTQHVGHCGVLNIEVVAGEFVLSDMGCLVPSTDGSKLTAVRTYDPAGAEPERTKVMPEGTTFDDAWRWAANFVRENAGSVDFAPPSERDGFVRPAVDYGPDGEPRQIWRVLVAPWGETADFATRREARRFAKAHAAEIESNWNY